MNWTRCCALLAVGVLHAGCGPAIQSADFGDGTAERGSGEILLYSTKLPECPYDEVGLISGKPRGFWMSMDEVLEEMRARAREMGGNAIIGLGSAEVVTGATQSGATVSLDTAERLAGTVVRFSDPGCRR